MATAITKRVRKAAKTTKTPAKSSPAKSTPPKAAKKSEPPAKAPRKSSGEPRRGRGALALDVLEVVEQYDRGDFNLPDGKTLTPSAISKRLVDEDHLKVAPSAGAITNVVRDFQKIGFVTVHPKPLAVKAITAAGKKEGYHVLKDKARDKAKKAK